MQATLAALPGPVRAALWYVGALSCWGLAAGVIRFAVAYLPALELGFLRASIAVLITLPWLIRARALPLPRRNFGLYLLRGSLEVVAIAAWFVALGLMQAADVVALGFTTPLFSTLLGALILGERIRLRRSLAILVGMAGALLIIRPGGLLGGGAIGWAALLPILCSAAAGASRIVGRRLSQTEPVVTIVASLGVITAPALLPLALAVWQPITLIGFALAAAIASISLLGHVLMVRALRLDGVSALAPYEFAQMLTAVAFGIAVLGEWPDRWTWIGSAVILGAAVYTVRREAKLARAAALKRDPFSAADIQ
ncbi:MAG: DMT family transporter [Rhodospirillales bacterium]